MTTGTQGAETDQISSSTDKPLIREPETMCRVTQRGGVTALGAPADLVEESSSHCEALRSAGLDAVGNDVVMDDEKQRHP